MDIHFHCTQCGKCCRDSKIPLTAAEAVDWLNRGHQVQLLCEASPWPAGVADDDPRAAHFKRRSFAAMSGSMPARIVVMLVANNTGPCPNLLDDKRCGIYDGRPLVCRIYPAEINPFVILRQGNKACPPEAWSLDRPVLQRDRVVMDEKVFRDIQRWRAPDADEAGARRRICIALHISDAAFVHEAVLVYSPPPELLASAITTAIAADNFPEGRGEWRFVSDRCDSRDGIVRAGGVALQLPDAALRSYEYLPFERKVLFGPYGV